MDVIILASGIGKRLGVLGAKTPKCLLNISKNYKIIDKITVNLNDSNVFKYCIISSSYRHFHFLNL